MRITVAGAEITDSVVEVIENLQTAPELIKEYTDTIDWLYRTVLLDIDLADSGTDTEMLSRLRVLQMIRRDLVTLASPPDVDLPENDSPTIEL